MIDEFDLDQDGEISLEVSEQLICLRCPHHILILETSNDSVNIFFLSAPVFI